MNFIHEILLWCEKIPEHRGKQSVIWTQHCYFTQSIYNRASNSAHGKIPPLIIRFISYQDKLAVLWNRSRLRGTQIYLKDDIPAELECKQTALRPIVNHLKPQDPAASIVNGDQIRFKGKNYNLKTITNIPADLSTIGIKENEKHVVFSGETFVSVMQKGSN